MYPPRSCRASICPKEIDYMDEGCVLIARLRPDEFSVRHSSQPFSPIQVWLRHVFQLAGYGVQFCSTELSIHTWRSSKAPTAAETAPKAWLATFLDATSGQIVLLPLFREHVLGQKSPLQRQNAALAKTSSVPSNTPALEKRERPHGTKLKISTERLLSRHCLN
jgi:hypothetical protein